MTIENLKQIAIKYATTKGSRVPLAPDELCNAVVQYFNEFLKITADINTIQVAVTEEGGNIVFTITGNTLDGKAFTPIVITVDHNDFVTNQEFEEFKTSVTKQLNNKRSVISSPASSYVVYTQANGLESNLPYSELANQTSTNIMARRANGTSDVKKGISGENVANMENIADVEAKIPDVTNLATKDELNNKLDKSNWEATVYIVDSNRIQNNVAYTSNPSPNTFVYRDDNSNFVVNSPTENGNPTPKSYVDNALAGKLDAAGNNTFTGENTFNNSIYAKNGVVAGDTTNYGANSVTKGSNTYSFPNKSGIFALTSDVPNSDTLPKLEDDNTYTGTNTFNNVIYAKNGVVAGDTTNYGANSVTKGSNTYSFPNKSGIFALTSDVPNSDTLPKLEDDNTYTGTNTFNNVIYAKNGVVAGDTTNYGANSVTKGSNTYSFPNKSGIFALTSDVPNSDTLPKLEDDNTYTGTNTFNNVIYAKNGVVAGDTTNYGANSVTKGSNTYSFPNKSGTFAMTTDVIKDPIYFISFYATEPTDPCHLRGIMMSKNSYGTGQKTNEEFAVMLSDNLYTNSDEGLAAPGKFAEKDILCIYSDDGLSIRYLDANNDNYELPTIMFFVMETEL